MFRIRQCLTLAGSTKVYQLSSVRNDDGSFCYKRIDACQKLPDAESFDLGNLVAAGVNLQRVNPQFIDNRPTDISGFEYHEPEENETQTTSSEEDK